MGLNNSQFDEIMREYNKIQIANRHLLEAREQEVYNCCPEYEELNAKIASFSFESAVDIIKNSGSIAAYKEQLSNLLSKRDELLKSHGFSLDYLNPIYTCEICKDTGFVNNSQCSCFKQRAVNLLYSKSNLKNIDSNDNFDNFRLDYYSDDEQDTDEITECTPRENMKNVYARCQEYVAEFDNPDSINNILFFGTTGIGKTFLSNCIAKALLDCGHSVVYLTASELFDRMADKMFSDNNDDEDNEDYLSSCDLLIIDDLGTELQNKFTESSLFCCINDRLLAKKATIISTNLNLPQIQDKYEDRIFSRITGNYNLLYMFGKDIRPRIKFKG